MNKFILTELRKLSTDEQLKLNGGEQITGKCSCSCPCKEGPQDTKQAIADGLKKSLGS